MKRLCKVLLAATLSVCLSGCMNGETFQILDSTSGFDIMIQSKTVIASTPDRDITLSASEIKNYTYGSLFLESNKWIITVGFNLHFREGDKVVLKQDNINMEGKKEVLIMIPYDPSIRNENFLHVINVDDGKEIKVESPIIAVKSRLKNFRNLSDDSNLPGQSDKQFSTKNNIISNVSWQTRDGILLSYIEAYDAKSDKKYEFEVKYLYYNKKFVIQTIKEIESEGD